VRDPRPLCSATSTMLPLLVAACCAAWLTATSRPARAGDIQCEQCCADHGAYSCATRIQVFAEGSELRLEGAGWRIEGLWVLDCDAGASFDATATAVLPDEPLAGEVITSSRKHEALDCFQDWCQLPANACIGDAAGGARTLRRCTDGQPMRASELLRKGAAPPSVYVSARPTTATTYKPRPAVGPLSTAASPAARDQAQPEAVFVTRTVVVSGGKTEVHETTSSSNTGTTTTVVRPTTPQPNPTPRPTSSRPAPTSTTTGPALRIVAEGEHTTPSTSSSVTTPAPPAPTPQPTRIVEPSPAPAPPPAVAHADIRVQEAVEETQTPVEYPPHLPAAGPLQITLDFELPPAPGTRCQTSSAVAQEATRRLDLGDEARIRGDNQTAVDEYRAAATLDRCNAIAWSALGQLAMQADDLDKARYSLDIAVHLRPEHYGALTNLGLTQEALGRCGDAIATFRRVLALRPSHPPALAGLARCGASP